MLQIHVSNNIRIRGASTPLRAAITTALTFDNPAHVEAVRKRKPTYGLDAKLKLFIQDLGDIVTPRGFLETLKVLLRTQGIDHSKVTTYDLTEGLAADFGAWNDKFKLRDYQAPFVEDLCKSNGVGIAPAGAGKTIMGMKIIHRIGKATLWLTHTKDLMYQTKDKAEKTLGGVGKIGIFGDDKQVWGDGKLIIATVQTLSERPDLVESLNQIIGLIIVDEAHHFPAIQFIETVGKFKAAKVLGVTATPDRKDELEMYLFMGIGPILHTIDRSHLYNNGSLLKPEIKFVYTKFNYEQASLSNDAGDNVDAGGEDLNIHELKMALINDQDRARLVAETILEHKDRGTAIVLTESVRYCFLLKEYVAQAAIRKGCKIPRMVVVHGGLQRYAWRVARNRAEAERKSEIFDTEWRYHNKTYQVKTPQYTSEEMQLWQVTGKERKDYIEAVRNKEYDILFATQLAREGLDIDHLTVEHMAMPKRGDANGKNNGSAVEQEVGRIQRPDPNNPNKSPILIDYIDYNVGIYKDQYYSRRKVYNRLGFKVPGKEKVSKSAEMDLMDAFLGNLPF